MQSTALFDKWHPLSRDEVIREIGVSALAELSDIEPGWIPSYELERTDSVATLAVVGYHSKGPAEGYPNALRPAVRTSSRRERPDSSPDMQVLIDEHMMSHLANVLEVANVIDTYGFAVRSPTGMSVLVDGVERDAELYEALDLFAIGIVLDDILVTYCSQDLMRNRAQFTLKRIGDS